MDRLEHDVELYFEFDEEPAESAYKDRALPLRVALGRQCHVRQGFRQHLQHQVQFQVGQRRAIGQDDIVDLDLFGRAAPPDHLRRTGARAFLNFGGRDRRVCDQPVPFFAVAQQHVHGVADGVSGDFVPGQEHANGQVLALAQADRLGVRPVRGQEVAGIIIAGALLVVGDGVAAVVSEIHHLTAGFHLGVEIGIARDDVEPAIGPDLDLARVDKR